MTVSIGVRNIELNHRLDMQNHELTLTLGIEVWPGGDGVDYQRLMDRISMSMAGSNPAGLLQALLEGCTGSIYRRIEEPRPGESAPGMVSGMRTLGGRNIDLGG